MSFGASGQLGGALVFGSWKGVSTARQYVKPANPQTPGQVAQRDLMKSVVAFWRSVALMAIIRTAWNKLAAVSGRPLSGFNAFTSNLVRLAAENPAASVAVDVTSTANDAVTFLMKNLDDGTTGDEAGNFAVAYGSSPEQMVFGAIGTIVAGELVVDVSADFTTADVLYFAIRKSGGGVDVYERAGIVEVTLT